MKLFITDREMPPLCGIVIQPRYMVAKVTHLTIASQEWDELFIDIDARIPEGTLRFLPKKCSKIRVCCDQRPTLHQMHLLIELYPELDGRIRKAYMKGESIGGVLPEMWEHGTPAGRDAV